MLTCNLIAGVVVPFSEAVYDVISEARDVGAVFVAACRKQLR